MKGKVMNGDQKNESWELFGTSNDLLIKSVASDMQAADAEALIFM